MKTVLMSSALALTFTQTAFADQLAVNDFYQGGIIEENIYTGPESTIATTPIPTYLETAPIQHEWKETEHSVITPSSASANVAPINSLTPSGDNYVNIGEYNGGIVNTLDAAPTTTRTLVERERVVIAPARTVTTNLSTTAGRGYVDDAFVNDRLAEYDTNGDGQVTTAEAIANIAPLINPNGAAVRDNINGANPIITLEQKGL